MEKRRNGRPVEFSLQYCKRSTGELVTYERAVLTSFLLQAAPSTYCLQEKAALERSAAA